MQAIENQANPGLVCRTNAGAVTTPTDRSLPSGTVEQARCRILMWVLLYKCAFAIALSQSNPSPHHIVPYAVVHDACG